MTVAGFPLDVVADALAELVQPPPPEPLPEFVAVQRPASADVMRAALILGWLPDEPYLRPAVPRTT